MVSFVNILTFLLALCQCPDFGVELSRFHGIGLVPHCLLENFVILAERREERKIDSVILGVPREGMTIVKKLGKDVDVILMRYQSIPIDGFQFIQIRPEISLLRNTKDHIDASYQEHINDFTKLLDDTQYLVARRTPATSSN